MDNPAFASAHKKLQSTLQNLLAKRAWDTPNIMFHFAMQLAGMAKTRSKLMNVTMQTSVKTYDELIVKCMNQIAQSNDPRWKELYRDLSAMHIVIQGVLV
jgi:hypothetical protein